MIGDAISYYHDLLTTDLAERSWSALDDAMRSENLRFGDRGICSVLRPYFLTPDEERFIQTSARHVLSALHKVFGAIPSSDYEPLLGLSPDEAALARIDAGFTPVETLARLDGFLVRDGHFSFIEFNAESPGGIAFGQALARIFRGLPIVEAFAERYSIRTHDTLDNSIATLLDTFKAWGGTTATPHVAIVDWRGAPTYPEFVMCSELLERKGCATRILDPSELSFEGGRLRAGAFEIDLVYRRVVASEIPDRIGLEHPLVEAARHRAACISSGFGAFALTSKVMFAILSDPARSQALTDDERAAVSACIPWTRVVAEGRTTDWTGTEVDLLDTITASREQLVVKPATDYGGKGVSLGWTTSAEDWGKAVRAALDHPSVVQRRVPLPSEPFPTMASGSLEFADYLADIDPYCFNGRTDLGAGTRLSRSQLLNVTAGGGSAAPVFIVEPRG